MTDDNPQPAPRPRPSRTSLGSQLVVLGQDLAELFERVSRIHDVSLVDADVLALLAAHDPQPMEPWQVGQVLGLQSNHLTMLFDRLAGKGLVERTVHPADRRRRLVRLTERGSDTAAVVIAGIARVERQVMENALTEEERVRLAELCTALRNGLRESVIPHQRTRPGP